MAIVHPDGCTCEECYKEFCDVNGMKIREGGREMTSEEVDEAIRNTAKKCAKIAEKCYEAEFLGIADKIRREFL
jgi:hypothetical protein